jgi:hypothetical protein
MRELAEDFGVGCSVLYAADDGGKLIVYALMFIRYIAVFLKGAVNPCVGFLHAFPFARLAYIIPYVR